uniref:LAMC3 protein n=1 Tax=Amazona collaria TaxID=241587 RepID=A0A8B9EWI6_9PSIT
PQAALLWLVALLWPVFGAGGSSSCWDPRGQPRRCMPVFENAAFGRAAQATNTCGSPPEEYCLQMGARHASALCHRCDASDPRHHHNASFLTDFHSQEESTWWQSQSMAFGIQHPNSVNITLHLGKSYEITYVRLKFHTSRPESFAIYKRSRTEGPWVPFQYYSASCEKTYGKRQRLYLRPGEDEQVAFCTDEFSDISPLSGGNVAFSTLEGRPSAYNFDGSPALQEWVTVTDLLISLNRLNTFGDDIFKDPKVLQSYYYAISDFSVGGRCKCNGHASECAPNEAGQLVCVCQHNTAGTDCERCQPFHQDRPWARGTAEAANECLPCNCSGRSDECFYDRELFRRSGHGGHCRNCRDNTAGPHCERCRPNHYRWEPQAACQPCHCHPAGERGRSDECHALTGQCSCQPGVTGEQCDRCHHGFFGFSGRWAPCRAVSATPAGPVAAPATDTPRPAPCCRRPEPRCSRHSGRSCTLRTPWLPRCGSWGGWCPSWGAVGCDQHCREKPGVHAGIALLTAGSGGAISLACKPPPALWEVLIDAGLVASGGPCSSLGSHCCCLCFKEIPQEIPQQPTDWSRRALEARALAIRYISTHRKQRLPARLGVQILTSLLRVSLPLQP